MLLHQVVRHRVEVVDGITVVAVAFGPQDGLLYVLELSDAAGYPTPGDGKVVRILRNGQIEEVITGLAVPTGMTFGPGGKLYVSNLGAAPGRRRTNSAVRYHAGILM
jgi:hypothetical protein